MAEHRERWLGTPEVASRLGLTLRTVYKLIDDGQLAAHGFGRVMRVRTDDLDRFIEASRVTPGTLAHLPAGSRRRTPTPTRRGQARRWRRTDLARMYLDGHLTMQQIAERSGVSRQARQPGARRSRHQATSCGASVEQELGGQITRPLAATLTTATLS